MSRIIVLLFLFLLVSSHGYAQRHAFFQKKITSRSDSTIVLPDGFISGTSIRIAIDSALILKPGNDFIYAPRSNTITLTLQTLDLLFAVDRQPNAPALEYNLTVNYETIDLSLSREYSNYSLPSLDATQKSGGQTKTQNANVYTPPETQNELSLVKSGGITRGITLGSGQDLSNQSSFNLTFNGTVDKDLNFSGALSEESSVIQPEGNTELLRDIDRIYINLNYLNAFSATLGDFSFSNVSPLLQSHSDVISPVFSALNRKVLGVELFAGTQEVGGSFSASSTRGKYFTNYFQGENGFQGPYRLSGTSGERDILVVAGTEKVYVDGVLQLRGEQNDYVVDYGIGEIRFQPRRIITNFSRITVDFQYTDEKYSRSLITGGAYTSLLSDAVLFGATYLREGDNQDAPRNLLLSENDKNIIARAGADPSKAIKSGVQYVGFDTVGRAKGAYVRIDTLIGSQTQIAYRYAPYDSLNASYSVSFSFVGASKGQYRKESSLVYTYVGPGSGDYDTVLFLPLPELNQLMGGSLQLRLLDSSLSLYSEGARSLRNPNRFVPAIDIQGNAYRLIGRFDRDFAVFGQTPLRINAGFEERFNDSSFYNFDRNRPAEYLRTYGIEDSATSYSTSLAPDERERTANILLSEGRIALGGKYGLYESKQTKFKGENFSASLDMKEDLLYAPNVHLLTEHIPSTYTLSDETSDWNRFRGSLSKSILLSGSTLIPEIAYSRENREAHVISTSFFSTDKSFRLTEISAGLNLIKEKTFSSSLSAAYSRDDSVRSNAFFPVSDNYKYHLGLTLSASREFTANINLSLLEKNYIDSLSKQLSRGDFKNLYISVLPHYQSLNNFSTLDLKYEVLSERSAKSERIFLLTQAGYGNYRYLGDLNGNGIQDANEFEIARYSDQGNYILITKPTESLFPTTTLNSFIRLRLAPSRLSYSQDDPWRFLSLISSETFIRVDEKSTTATTSDVYFMKLSTFQSDSTTLSGVTELQEDLYLLENDPTKQFRFRFLERKSFNQFNTGGERTYLRNLGLRVNINPAFTLSSETNLEHFLDKAFTNPLSSVKPHNTEKVRASSEWSYTPIGLPSSFSIKADLLFAKDNDSVNAPSVFGFGISERTSYSFTEALRTTLSLGFEELTPKGVPDSYYLPFSMTEGRDEGSTIRWQLTTDYNIGYGLVASATYDARYNKNITLPGNIIHTARAEIRATF